MNVLSRDLSLRFGNFFYKDPGHCIPACVGVIISISSTIADPESHSHLPFVDVVTVPFNMADTLGILRLNCPQVDNTVNWQRSWTFCTVEREIPTLAATGATVDSKGASPVNMEGCVRKVLREHTVLWKITIKKEMNRPAIDFSRSEKS